MPMRRRSTSGRLTDWAEMFTDDAFYVIISRENADRGMPVGPRSTARTRA